LSADSDDLSIKQSYAFIVIIIIVIIIYSFNKKLTNSTSNNAGIKYTVRSKYANISVKRAQ